MIDNITALSAEGSQFAVEAIPHRPERDTDQAREMMRRSTAKWQGSWLQLDWEELGFEGERNDVAAYLEGLGWQPVGTPMTQLWRTTVLTRSRRDSRLSVNGRHRLLQRGTEQVTAPRRGLQG